MLCYRARRWMSPYVDGELSPARRGRLEAHFAACPRCAQLLDGMRSDWDALSRLPAPALPAGLEARVLAAAWADRPSPATAGWGLGWLRPRLALGFAVGAGAAAGVVLGLLLSGNPAQSDAPQTFERGLVAEAFGDPATVAFPGVVPAGTGGVR